ncbi:conserved hypothetical protein [Ixodes scapularis]|uniref:MAU2 chromatid cohesion factor homolog n=1 Tax=Ixodes scapularis TaxID=6945 RepID=B7Q4I8_IXOSC|nr:conserved hypothetical protein [Ixodes scapularis]|eukprot:XP_002400648.1 conserved hypothetical protein [Ixodes scapularis]
MRNKLVDVRNDIQANPSQSGCAGQETIMASSAPDATYLALLGLAEEFRTMSPPSMKNCIRCLLAIFQLNPAPRVEALTHLQLGMNLLQYTNNTDLAQSHLEKAPPQIAGLDDVKFQAANALADLYEKRNQTAAAKQILTKAIESSRHTTFWHCRLIFRIVQIFATERDYHSACSFLGMGAEYSHMAGAHYTRILFLLSEGMLLMVDRKLSEVHQVLNQAGQLVEAWQGSMHHKEALKVFFLVLQVCHYLSAGQVKSVKPCLKQLQQGIQTITSLHSDEDGVPAHPGDMFHWMPKEHMCVLVYLVTVLHSMQAGYMDKAHKYTDKALMQIEKLKNTNPTSQGASEARAGKENGLADLPKGGVAGELADIEEWTQKSTASMELRILASLNLVIVYLRCHREKELQELLARLNPETLPSASHSLRAAAYYVHGFNAFFQARYNDAKRYLRETLKMANAEDLNRLTSCSLVLLGHIFFSLGNSRESMNMVTPAMQLASKIPDVHVQLWASALLKDLYRLCGQPVQEQEAIQTHANFSQLLLNDHFQASQLPEHGLIQWIDGEPPVMNTTAASTSSAIPNMLAC